MPNEEELLLTSIFGEDDFVRCVKDGISSRITLSNLLTSLNACAPVVPACTPITAGWGFTHAVNDPLGMCFDPVGCRWIVIDETLTFTNSTANEYDSTGQFVATYDLNNSPTAISNCVCTYLNGHFLVCIDSEIVEYDENFVEVPGGINVAYVPLVVAGGNVTGLSYVEATNTVYLVEGTGITNIRVWEHVLTDPVPTVPTLSLANPNNGTAPGIVVDNNTIYVTTQAPNDDIYAFDLAGVPSGSLANPFNYSYGLSLFNGYFSFIGFPGVDQLQNTI